MGIVAVIAAFCFLGPLVYSTDQVTVHLDLAELPPGDGHPLGTDASGYDVLGRLMAGGRSSLELGFAVALATTVVGTLYGAIAGYVGGFVDSIMMRTIDTFLAIPGLVLLLIMVSMFTPSLWMIILLLSLLSWLAAARLVRGEVLTLRTREYVQASRMMGGTGRRDRAAPPRAERGRRHHRQRHLHHRRLDPHPVDAELPRTRAAAARTPTGAPCSPAA